MTESSYGIARRAGSDDAKAIALLEEVCFSCPYNEAAVTDLLAASYHPSFVFYGQDGTLLGYLLGQCLSPEGDLLRIAVDPHARRQGVARILLDAFLAHLKSEKCTVCYLDVREHNAPAQALYASRGFHPFDRRKNYYRLPSEDAIVMRCILEQ